MKVKSDAVNGGEGSGEGTAAIEVQRKTRKDERVKSSAVEDWVQYSGSVQAGESIHVSGMGDVCYHVKNRLDESASLW